MILAGSSQQVRPMICGYQIIRDSAGSLSCQVVNVTDIRLCLPSANPECKRMAASGITDTRFYTGPGQDKLLYQIRLQRYLSTLAGACRPNQPVTRVGPDPGISGPVPVPTGAASRLSFAARNKNTAAICVVFVTFWSLFLTESNLKCLSQQSARPAIPGRRAPAYLHC